MGRATLVVTVADDDDIEYVKNHGGFVHPTLRNLIKNARPPKI
jgi:hypothetical protein